jgi:hypothetical protein
MLLALGRSGSGALPFHFSGPTLTKHISEPVDGNLNRGRCWSRVNRVPSVSCESSERIDII